MANVSVKNKRVFTTISCSCSNYICHWENYSGKKASTCSRLWCSSDATVGAHVIKCHGNSSSSQYIVPLCSSHNSSAYTECFDLKSGTMLVPVTSRTKCKTCN